MNTLDVTHDPARRSWVASANGHADFPIQNLPLGIFSPPGDATRRVGCAIGDEVLDVAAAHDAGLFSGEAARASELARASRLNALLAVGTLPRKALREQLSHLLVAGAPEQPAVASVMYRSRDCRMHLPADVGDYTDFYAGIHHAMNVGRQFRPDNPLLPNYKHVPIGYHGRASSVCVSGHDVRRPSGQRRSGEDAAPSFGPSRRLDYELELGVWIGPGNPLGSPISIADAPNHIAGFCLLNDWSARDIQAWEYQPLGPFLAKSFATSVSAWLITPEALAPFRIAQAARAPEDPSPLPYLYDDGDQRGGALDVELEVLLLTECLRRAVLPPHRLALTNTRHLYWTMAQLVAHHTSNGCNLRPGDLLGSGTISSPDAEGCGSLLETTEGGKRPLTLATGNTRTFLEDGDEVIFRARAKREGYASIGFGELRGRIVP
jgi:fumarylacetoacetase